MNAGAVVILVMLGVVAVIALWYLTTFNAFVRLRNIVGEAWKQVDVELQRRHDLIPNLVSTAATAARFERETLAAVTNARAAAQQVQANPGAGVGAQSAAEQQLSQALGRFLAVAESYPELKAVQAFAELQNSLEDTENRIAASRRFYNGNVRALNTKIETVPSNIVAGAHAITQAEYFEIDDPAARQQVSVRAQFDGLFGGTPPQA